MSAPAGLGRGLHATAVVFGESGVVIIGPSGSGKSALALALLAHAKMTGRFAALLGDDRVWLRAESGRLIASGAQHMAGLIERRATGLQAAASEPAAVVRLVVDLSGRDRTWPRWPGEPNETVFEGVRVPRLALSSVAGAADNAVSVDDRLNLLSRSEGAHAISLEQSAAVHKIGSL